MNESIKQDNTSILKNFNHRLNTPSGIIHCAKEEELSVTPHGYLPYFAQYIHESGLFEHLVNKCPIKYQSNNAPAVKDVVGTILLSILSGHTRYSHAGLLYGDSTASEILNLNKIVSPDSLSRGLDRVKSEDLEKWLDSAYLKCCEPLLSTPYILDLDPTVKVLYGNQEGAKVGYNPSKPGRKSHCYHAFFIASLRIVLDVEVHPGNETAGLYSHNRLWRLLDNLPTNCKPSLVRGDIAYGNDKTIIGCENRNVNYLFKLRMTKSIKQIIASLETPGNTWSSAGDEWTGIETEVALSGWKHKRRVVILRRQHKSKKTQKELPDEINQMDLPFICIEEGDNPKYEYQVLITNTSYDILALGQLYRDRGDCENNFDELKNHWGWGGFNAQNFTRTKIMARLIGVIYNWWNIFCRLAEPDKHIEAQTSRPILQNIIGRITKTGRSRIMYLSAIGKKAENILLKLNQIAEFLSGLNSTASQLNENQKWTTILKEAFKTFLQSGEIKQISEGQQLLLPL